MNSNNKIKRKRNRRALSCTQCQTRKIKCDRNVPHCNSCVIRGIQNGCRWGDERDEEIEFVDASGKRDASVSRSSSQSYSDEVEEYTKQTNTTSRNKKKAQKRKAVGGDEVGLIIETVVKRLKKSKRFASVSSSSEESSDSDECDDDFSTKFKSKSKSRRSSGRHTSTREENLSPDLKELLYFNVTPAVNNVARKMKMTAFGGFMESNPFFPTIYTPETRIDVNIITTSLRRLPSREVVSRLTDVYMNEMEPMRGLFNRTIWNSQMEEFWRDVDELGIITGTLPINHPYDLPLYALEEHCISSKDDKKRYKDLSICKIPNQGMISLVFSLCEQGARFCDLSELVHYGCISSTTTDADVRDWCDILARVGQLHFDLCEPLPLPTLWSLQYLMINDFITASLAHPSRGGSTDVKKGYAQYAKRNSTAISMAVTLGLNRLGNGYDDAYNVIAEQENGQTEPRTDPDTIDHAGLSTNPNVTQSDKQVINSTMRFGSWIADFEGNLAHRELGRKLWTNLVLMDCFISNHLNQYFSIHDDVDFTSAPLPLDDHDLVSPHAADLIIQSNPTSSIPTRNALLAFSAAFAKISRFKVKLENKKGTPLPYSDILKIDDQYQAIFDKLPDYLRLPSFSRGGKSFFNTIKSREKKSKGTKADLWSDERYLVLQRSILNDQAYFRRLHAHRLHLGKGFKDLRFRHSTMKCLEAAYGIYEAREDLEQAESLVQHASFLQSHLVHAALTFQLVLLHEMERWKIAKESYNGPVEKFVYTHELADIDETLTKLNKCLNYLQPRAVNMKKLQEFMPGLENFLRGANVRRAAQLRELRGEIHSEGSNKRTGSRSRKRQSDIPIKNNGANLYGDQKGESAGKDGIKQWQPFQLPSFGGNGYGQGSAGNIFGNGTLPSGAVQVGLNNAIDMQGGGWQGSMYKNAQDTSSSIDTSSGTDRSTTLSNQYPNSIGSTSLVDASPSDGQTPSQDVFDPPLWSLDMLFPNYYDAGIDLMAALEHELLGGVGSTNNQNGNQPGLPNLSYAPSNSAYPNTATQQSFHQL